MSRSAEQPPRFFVDRSLGGVIVPRLLRDAGVTLETMRERYGERRAQEVSDVEWLADVGSAGLVVLMKDKRIRTRPAERAAVETYGIRCFCIARGDLTGVQMAAAYVPALPAIYRAATRPGPFIFQVSGRGLLRVL